MFFMDFATARRLEARKFAYTLAGTVPAFNGPQAGAISLEEKIQQGFNFWSELMAISYTTLNNAGADDGVSVITVQFRDGANQLGMSNTFIDVATIAAPGRQRAVGVAGDPSNALAVPGGIPYPHLWAGTGSILADLRGSSNTANIFRVTFQGYLIPEKNMALFDQWIAGGLQQPAGSPVGPGVSHEALGRALAGFLSSQGGGY